MNDLIFISIILISILYCMGAIAFFIKLKITQAEIAKYKTHFQNFPTPKFIINAHGIIQDATLSAAHLFGFERVQDIVGYNLNDVLSLPQTLDLDSNDDSFSTQIFEHSCDIRGHKKTLSIKIYKTIESDFLVIINDLTAVNETQHRIDMLMSALESSHDGIALINSSGQLVFANPALWAIYDIPFDRQKDILNHSWILLYSEKGQGILKERILPYLQIHKSWSGAEWVKSATGRKFFADLSIVRYGSGFFGVVRDRTDLMAQRALHEESQKKLQMAQKNNAIARIIRGMVHDFNNTLSVIMGHSELLEQSTVMKPDDRQSLASILKATEKSKQMLLQIRSLIPKETIYETPSKALDIIPVIKDVMSEYRMMNRHFALLSAEAKIDSDRLQAICRHLISNALDACGGDFQKVAISIHALEPPPSTFSADDFKIHSLSDECHELTFGAIDKSQNYVTLSVHDAGLGIDRDILTHICEPFFTTKGKHHAGLGLSLVLSFVKEAKAAFRIFTRVGQGTEISIYIPTLPKSLIWPDRSNIPGMNFMVVDTDAQNRRLLHTMLRAQGHDVFECACPLVALDEVRARREDFDIILAAREMMPIKGDIFAQDISIDFPDLPIVMIDDMGGALDLPAAQNIKAALNKPINLAILNCEIEKIISA